MVKRISKKKMLKEIHRVILGTSNSYIGC
jgi:hypothetical protein